MTGTTVGARTAVSPAAVAKYRKEFENQGEETLRAETTKIEARLDDVLKGAGDKFDLAAEAVGKVEGFDGSIAERCTAFVELHSRLAAAEEIMASKHMASHVRDEMMALREGAARDYVNQRGDDIRGLGVRAVMLSDKVFASIEEAHGKPISADFSVHDAMRASGGSLSLDSVYDAQQYLAAVVTTSAGWDPFVRRQPGHTMAISRPLQVIDALPMSTTDQHSIKYMVQTTRTASTVVEKNEGAASGEAVMEWTERTEQMQEIPGHIPVTETQLEDEPQVRAIIDMDLRLMVMQRLDGQLINGNGTSPNIAGIYDTRNSVTAVDYDWSKTGTSRDDQINDAKKAKTALVLTGRVMPNVYFFHHNIWDEISLAETTAAGYYLGSPAMDFTERLWGLPVVQTDHLDDGETANDIGGIVADTMYTRHWVRRAVHSEIGLSGTDFVKRQLTIRAAIRCCLQVRRPKAVSTFTM